MLGFYFLGYALNKHFTVNHPGDEFATHVNLIALCYIRQVFAENPDIFRRYINNEALVQFQSIMKVFRVLICACLVFHFFGIFLHRTTCRKVMPLKNQKTAGCIYNWHT
jgi:uncharacterized membrane protein